MVQLKLKSSFQIDKAPEMRLLEELVEETPPKSYRRVVGVS
jgi:hypothetical protein